MIGIEITPYICHNLSEGLKSEPGLEYQLPIFGNTLDEMYAIISIPIIEFCKYN